MVKFSEKIKIVVTGGGTGGHVVPLMAVVDELKTKGAEIIYIGSGNNIEKEAASKEEIQYRWVMSGKLRRYFSWQNFVDPFKIMIGFFQAFAILLFNRPQIVFAKGGYVTFPVALAAWVLRIPIITHESDVVMGLANRWEIKLAKKVCVGFPAENYKDVPLNKIIYTGNPVNQKFNNLTIKQISNGLKIPVIMVTGGSQGARFINQIIASISKYLTVKYHIIHVAGKNDYEWLRKNHWPNYELYSFTDKMPQLLKKADLVISRAGANTLAEISALGKPSILIPLPTSANNHQMVNAKVYEKSNAAVVVTEKGLTPDNLKSIIELLMKDDKMRHEIGENAKKLFQPDAAEGIANEIINLVKRS